MIKNTEEYDLKLLYNYNDYPFMKDIEYTCNITNDYGNVLITNDDKLIVEPNLRGTIYTIQIIAQDKKLPIINNSNIEINVYELPVLELIENDINIYSSNVKIIEEELLNNYTIYNSNHYSELSNLIGFDIITENIYNNVELNQDCNLTISTDLRGKIYNIGINTYYKKEQNISNNDLNYIIQEEYPVIYKENLNTKLSNLTIEEITYDLNNSYEILLPEEINCNILYEIELSKTIRDGYYNNKPVVEILNGSNLNIIAEYRNDEYDINIKAYIDYEGYKTCNNELIINVSECNIIPIEFIETKPYNFSNLYNEIYVIDLSEYISTYPFAKYINYEILEPTYSNVYVQGTDLIFLAGNENNSYDVNIKVIDYNFGGINYMNTFKYYTTSIVQDESQEPIVW